MDQQESNDEELVRRYYQADGEALTVLFQRHKDGLLNFALRLIGNRADAEDAVSHTFMMVCEKKYTIKEGASFKTWAYTVARNLCLSKFRSRSKFSSLWHPKKDSTESQQMDIVDPKGIVRDQLNHQEEMAMIQKAINKLPEEQKEALLLRSYHGFTYEEIAQVLNCSLEKVKVLIFRARTYLKGVI
jgi:RNA polymerase sigma-70 factor (ECF subfamily)